MDAAVKPARYKCEGNGEVLITVQIQPRIHSSLFNVTALLSCLTFNKVAKNFRHPIFSFAIKKKMDSINAQQPEKNFQNLSSIEAREKIKELIEKAKNTCFFCTNIRTGEGFSTRPMSVQKIDDDGTLWFLSPIDSHKNEDLLHDPATQLLFKGSDYSDFLSLYGKSVLSRDEGKIKELWEPLLKTWFTEGKDDPRITVIEFTPEHGYYWDTKHAQVVAFAKQVIGAAIGKTLDDSIEGNLRP